MLIAHRGLSEWYPENTLIAFEQAILCGADAIEMDVRLSKDNIPVVIHDETLERTTCGLGQVDETMASAIVSLDAGSIEYPGQNVPR